MKKIIGLLLILTLILTSGCTQQEQTNQNIDTNTNELNPNENIDINSTNSDETQIENEIENETQLENETPPQNMPIKEFALGLDWNTINPNYEISFENEEEGNFWFVNVSSGGTGRYKEYEFKIYDGPTRSFSNFIISLIITEWDSEINASKKLLDERNLSKESDYYIIQDGSFGDESNEEIYTSDQTIKSISFKKGNYIITGKYGVKLLGNEHLRKIISFLENEFSK